MMRGFFAQLTPDQQRAAIAYEGPENHGDDKFRWGSRERGMKVSPAAELWGKLYGLLCRWETIHYGLASMPERDQPRLDDEAEKIITEFMSQQPPGV